MENDVTLVCCWTNESQLKTFIESVKKRNRPITPRHIAKKKRSETDLSNSDKFSIWQHRNIRTK